VRIAVFHNLPSGGGKRALCNLVKHLVRVGHHVDVYVPSTAFADMRDTATAYRVYSDAAGGFVLG
jgi:hypothetical protein